VCHSKEQGENENFVGRGLKFLKKLPRDIFPAGNVGEGLKEKEVNVVLYFLKVGLNGKVKLCNVI